MAGNKCDVCGFRESIGVACSGLGPMSQAYCNLCASLSLENPEMVIATVEMAGGWEHCAPWLLGFLSRSIQLGLMVLVGTPLFVKDDGFGCCGGNDENPPQHCADCPIFPWTDSPPEITPRYKG